MLKYLRECANINVLKSVLFLVLKADLSTTNLAFTNFSVANKQRYNKYVY